MAMNTLEAVSSVLDKVLGDVMDAAMEVDHAVCGALSVFDPKFNILEARAQHYLEEPFRGLLQTVHLDSASATARACRFRRQITIPDITKAPYFKPFLADAKRLGFRSVQATPILGSEKECIGVLTTHFRGIHYLAMESRQALRYHARVAANVIEQAARI